ncbi:MAG: hypothetical protein RJB60_18 [Pseudomonadota bacterium]
MLRGQRRDHLGQGLDHKRSLQVPRVRQGQFEGVACMPAQADQVKIKRSGGISVGALTAMIKLNGLQGMQQLQWRQASFKRRHGIEVIGPG